MNLLLTIKNLEQKEKLQNLIESKSQKLLKYITHNIKVTWNVFSENGMHLSEVKVSGFKGADIKASARAESPYKVVDIAVNKLQAQLRKKADREKNRF